MINRILFILLLAVATVATSLPASAQVKEPKITNTEWTQPYQPFRIVGNLYYVGTYDLACYLITTTKGNILINTGTAASVTQIKSNIEALGFKYADIKILLTTQVHYDHMGAMAAIKKQTKAKLMLNEKEVGEAESGGSSDYALGGNGKAYEPVKPDRLLYNNDTIQLGETKLVMLHHPGHTKGSCSYLFTTTDQQRSYKVLIANLPTIVTDKSFSAIPTYPSIATDYAYTFKSLKGIRFDIWVASHAGQFNLHAKHKPSDAYNPAAFIDQSGFETAINDLQKEYEKKMKQ